MHPNTLVTITVKASQIEIVETETDRERAFADAANPHARRTVVGSDFTATVRGGFRIDVKEIPEPLTPGTVVRSAIGNWFIKEPGGSWTRFSRTDLNINWADIDQPATLVADGRGAIECTRSTD